jgi:hypothetical protein
MKSVAALALAACLLAVANGARPVQAPAQKPYEPPSGPGAGQKLLATFVGDWTVVKTFHPRNGSPIRAEGRCRQTMIHDGRFLQSEFVFEQAGKPTSGLGLIGFEPETGTFTSVWTDSRQTRMSLRRSRDKFDGERIVLYSRSLEEDGDEARSTKTVTHLEDGGRRLVHRQYALSAEGEERLMMELLMTRK